MFCTNPGGCLIERFSSLCAGLVHGLGGEAAGVQQVRSAPLQALRGSRRLVRPLQGATQPGQLPHREVIQSAEQPDFLKQHPPEPIVMQH